MTTSPRFSTHSPQSRDATWLSGSMRVMVAFGLALITDNRLMLTAEGSDYLHGSQVERRKILAKLFTERIYGAAELLAVDTENLVTQPSCSVRSQPTVPRASPLPRRGTWSTGPANSGCWLGKGAPCRRDGGLGAARKAEGSARDGARHSPRHAQRRGDLGVQCHLLALVPGQRPAQLRREVQNAAMSASRTASAVCRPGRCSKIVYRDARSTRVPIADRFDAPVIRSPPSVPARCARPPRQAADRSWSSR